MRLDPTIRSAKSQKLYNGLSKMIVGQDRAVISCIEAYQSFEAGLYKKTRPLLILLCLGPTGVGKSEIARAFVKTLFGQVEGHLLTINCGEYTHGHETAKLIGSPPGYVGGDIPGLLRQEAINDLQTPDNPISVILLDEIEKAGQELAQLLLGIFDTGSLTLGNNQKVDMTKCIFFMTGNLGNRDILKLVGEGNLGLAPSHDEDTSEDLDSKVYRTTREAAKKFFSPEFINRVDRLIVFRFLSNESLTQVLDLELYKIEEMAVSQISKQFRMTFSQSLKEYLLANGTDKLSGARELTRLIKRKVVNKLSALLSSGQIILGDLITIDYDKDTKEIIFDKITQGIENISLREEIAPLIERVSIAESILSRDDAEWVVQSSQTYEDGGGSISISRQLTIDEIVPGDKQD